MLYSTKNVFRTEEDLLQFLTNTSVKSGGPVAIVAGHFMLMYDDKTQSLVPMIWQDSTNPRVQHFAQEKAGSFPTSTFRTGLRLREILTSSGSSARLALVVNDHIFQTQGWEQQNLPKGTSSSPGSLRKQFYRTADPIPDTFKAVLASLPASASAEALLGNDNLKRSDSDILPRETHFFSEQNLRRRFDQRTRKRLLAMEGFSQVEESKGKYRVYFTDTLLGSRLCLSDSNGCGCSGETVELLWRAPRKLIQAL